MARYIDTDKFNYTRVSVYWGKDNRGRDVYRDCFVAFKSDIDEMPTADVAPKSEVAREIFEEIERETKNHGITYAQRKIAELKKKYTEERE